MAGGSQAPVVNSCSKASRLVDAPLGGGGHVGADDGEVGQSLQGAPAAPGGALLDLDRADVSFRQVVRPGHGKIDHEPWNHGFVLAEPRRGRRVRARVVLSVIPAVVVPR